MAKKDTDDERILKARVSPELHMKFKVKCTQNYWQIEDVVEALAEGWVEGIGERSVKEWMMRNKK